RRRPARLGLTASRWRTETGNQRSEVNRPLTCGLCRLTRRSSMFVGSYEVLGTIGHGGMGIVYRARHRLTGKLVAVKVLSPEADAHPVLRERFVQEFAVTRRLHHPNLVQGLDFGMEDGLPYLVMELVEGQSLGERLHRQGRLPADQAVSIICQVADA